MTEVASSSPIGLPAVGPAGPARSAWGRVVREVLGRWGPRLGLLWIGVVALCAVLAPLLASSHPYVLKTIDGQWSSPLLRHLTPADVTLLVLAAAALVLLLLRFLSAKLRWLIFALLLAAVIPLAVRFVHPPQAVVFSQYREMRAQGQIAWALWPPIPFSPNDRLGDRSDLTHPLPPDSTFLLGTEDTGADIAASMIHACRIAMAVGFIATGIALLIGVSLGALMGYFSGLVDLLGMRLVEIVSAVPTFFLLLAFVAFFPRNLYIMMVIIGVTGWVGYARFVRAEFLKLRQQDFVQAAIACGLPLHRILFRHMLPNGVAPVLVEASFGVASAILYEATLSFLGLGLVEEPSWGRLLDQATGSTGAFYWWLASFPGLAIFLTVFAYNLIGEALRDALDPHTQRAAQL